MNSKTRIPPYLALVPVCAGVFIAADDQTVVVTILPQVLVDLKVSVTELDRASWTITGYLLGYLAAMPLIGRLSDVWGHRRLFAISLAVFMVGSVAVALSSTLAWLIAARVFQAVGAGALVPISIAIAGDLFPPGSRAVPYGILGASVEAGGVIGPLWGGLIPKHMDKVWEFVWTQTPLEFLWFAESIIEPQRWKWVFWINLPLAFAVLVGLVLLVAPSPRYRTSIDYVGGGLLALALATLTLALSRFDVLDPAVVGLIAISVTALVLFVIRVRSVEAPLLPVSMFRGWSFRAANATHIFVGAALIIAMVTIPLMANTAMALTPLEGGLRLMRLTAAIPVGALAGGFACRWVDYRIPAIAGLVFAAVGFLLMNGWEAEVEEPALTLHLAIAGFGFGLLIAPISLAATESVGEENRATAAATVTAMRLVGMTFGLAALTAWGADRFQVLVSGIPLPFPGSEDSATQAQQRLEVFDEQLTSAGMTLFSEFFLIAMVLCLVALVPAALMIRRR